MPSDRVDCGPGRDKVVVDLSDRIWGGCEQVSRPGGQTKPPPAPPVSGNSIVLYDEPFICKGPVDIGLVKVTMPSTVQDAIRLAEDCSGRIGRIEIDTWTADGIKVQNHGTVAHDLVIESGYVKCHDVAGNYHQDGIQAMGGTRLTFRKLTVDCLGNANLFVNQGGMKVSVPTERDLRPLRSRTELRPDALRGHVDRLRNARYDDLRRPLPRCPGRAEG